MPTIREIINNISTEVFNESLLPDRAVNIRRELSSIYGNVLSEIQEKELIYNRVLLSELDKEKAASKARIVAQVSKEYQEYLMAKNTEKMLLRMMSALNTFIKSKEEEFKSGKY